MQRITFLVLTFLVTMLGQAQITINEVDADTPSTDTQEFVELKTDDPYTSLDGYVLVLFNGSDYGNNEVWWTLDLNGFTTDINGLWVAGGPELSPVPNYYISSNTILNGNAAFAIYQGSSFDFPEGTQATTNNLVDALVYSVNNPPSQTLLDLLDEDVHMDENENGNKDNESIQRANDGSWYVAESTPRALNDGSGVQFIGIEIVFDQDIINEGDEIEIDFVADETLTEDLTFDFTLISGDFNEDDFEGSTNLTIPAGQNSVTANITVLEDGEPEEDELMIIQTQNLPEEYVRLNNNIEAWVIDADFFVSPYGTPTNPTYDVVQKNIPSGYYDEIDGKSGQELRDALRDIISEEGEVRAHTYADVWTMLYELDENPENSNQSWLLYIEEPRQKFLRQRGSVSAGYWNREHVFPRSRGGFYAIEEDDIATGKDVWLNTNADSIRHGMTDIHALRATDATENISRGNKNFGDYNGPLNNQGSFKGDVSRAAFYMAIRYNFLEIVEGFPTETENGQLGDLTTLLQWHEDDPVDDFEKNRNNLAYEWQRNRNPFLDFPDLVDYIWGDMQGEVWNNPLSTEGFNDVAIKVFPNPSSGNFYIEGINDGSFIQVYDMNGKQIYQTKLSNNQLRLNDFSKGTYILKINTENASTVKRIIIE
ncbi:MAG: endonuclease [Bacteroidota bacterium]